MQKLYANQLAASLKKQLAPVYLVFGEEPLQKIESVDEIRQAARQAGFTERQSFQLDNQLDWDQLFSEFTALSLFAERKVIELDLGSGKLTATQQDQLKKIPAMLHADVVLLLHASKAASEFSKAGWFKTLAEQGVQVQFYPLDDNQFMRWLKERAQLLGLKLQTDALQLLQHHAAGNLLAARQELEKLALTNQGQWLDGATLAQLLADQSHFTVFQLADSMLAGQGEAALHRLDRLLQQDTETVIIAWQLQKEASTLLALQQLAQPTEADYKKFGIWPKRIPLYQQALLRLSPQWLHYLLQELAAFDRGFKAGLLPHPPTALAHLVSLFISPLPKTFSLQQYLQACA